TEVLSARSRSLFARYERPIWERLQPVPVDLDRLSAMWAASPTVGKWVARDFAYETVLAELVANKCIDVSAASRVVTEVLTRPPELASISLSSHSKELAHDAAANATWLAVGNQVLKLPCVKF